jgi:hypothetical protein
MPNSKYAAEIFPLTEQDPESIYEYYFAESQEREVAAKATGKMKEVIVGPSHMPASIRRRVSGGLDMTASVS